MNKLYLDKQSLSSDNLLGATNGKSFHKYVFSPVRLLVICLVVILLTATLLRFFGGESSDPPSLTGLLQYIEDAPSVDFVTGFRDYRIDSSWGPFNFLRNFFNWFTSMISIGVWLAQSFINLLMYALYFVKYLFLF